MRIVLGTRSPDKVREIRQILSETMKGIGIELLDLNDFPHAPFVEEDQQSFLGNARKKALTLAAGLREAVLADDSGLEVDALNGEPGVRSHRWAGERADDEANNRKLKKMLTGVPLPMRSARYRCAMALASPGGKILPSNMSEGFCEGIILEVPKGKNGFGYDPYFLSLDLGKTFAQASAKEKNRVSHRAKALRTLFQMNSRKA